MKGENCQTLIIVCLLLILRSLSYSSPLKAGYNHPLLGRGYESSTNRLKEVCLSGSIVVSQNRRFSLHSEISSSFDQLIKQTNGFWELGLNLGIIGGKGRTEFMIRNTSNKTKMTLVNHVNASSYDLHFSNYRVLAQAQSVARRGENTSDDCGDAFINHLTLGKSLYIASSLIFPSEANLKKFETKITISAFFGLIKKTKTFTKAYENYAADAVLQIRVIQLGGDQEIFQKLDSDNPRYCDKNSIQKCLDFYNKVNEYVNSDLWTKSDISDEQIDSLYPLVISGVDYRFSEADELSKNEDVSEKKLWDVKNYIHELSDIYTKIEDLEIILYLGSVSSIEKEKIYATIKAYRSEIEQKQNEMYGCLGGRSPLCL